MTNRKTTKRALFTSTLALLMCVAMLIGTTFAWFTDTASTNVNKVQAGTLDFELLDAAGNSLEGQTLSWQKAEGGAEQEVLWEPGCTYNLQPITIKYNGNLAAKCKIIITGINGDAKLNEAIDWTASFDTTNGLSTFPITYYAANSGVATTGEATVPTEEADVFHVTGGEQAVLTISGTMKTAAGNEYQGLSIDGIAITVVATQDTVEYDSTTNEYDKDAPMPIINVTTGATATEINAAIEEAVASGTTQLTLNVNAAEGATAENPSTVTLDPSSLAQIANMTVNLGENVDLHLKGNWGNPNAPSRPPEERAICSVQEGNTLKITGKGSVSDIEWLGACGGATLIIENEGGFSRVDTADGPIIKVAGYGANVIIRNWTLDRGSGVNPLILVGDSTVPANGAVTPSKLTLENVVMKNYHYGSNGVLTVGGVGINVYQGAVDITTNNVTFSGSTSLNAVTDNTCPAFLKVTATNNPNVTLNGVTVD